jgi:ABC-type nitrate/sulfonate/bicarbonate transport system substrate-binding protein
MTMSIRLRLFLVQIVMMVIFLQPEASPASGELLVAYGGHNETMAPMWVGVDRGLFKKHGVDPRVLQTRSGPIMMATLASGGAPLVWAAPTSAISAALGGMKLGCFAVGNDRIPRELIARKGIESLDDLRGKTFGVQSIGGGFWLATMAVLNGLDIDPDKYKLSMRVIGDTGTVTQALTTGNIDAAVVPYSFADMAKRAGARSLADAGTVKLVYQGTAMCARKDSSAINNEAMIGLTRGIVEALVYIQEPANKREVSEILKKHLRLTRDEDIEASYKVTRLQMTALDIAPNAEAWKRIQRLLTRVNPKVKDADLDQLLVTSTARALEESGFLPEMRKRLGR